jgi:hypothetical protein
VPGADDNGAGPPFSGIRTNDGQANDCLGCETHGLDNRRNAWFGAMAFQLLFSHEKALVKTTWRLTTGISTMQRYIVK